jgi:hypothetical protein
MDYLLNVVRDPEQLKIVRLWLWSDRLRWFVIGVFALMVAQGIALVIYG